METGTKGPPLRLEHLPAYLDDKLEHETQVLDLLIVAQARGQGHPELWDKLHSAALRDDRLTELAFAYEKLNQDRRVRIMPPHYQAQIFLNAARFFVRALGDIDGAQTALERAVSLVPGHPEAFEQLRRILEDKGERDKLIGLHLAAVGPKTEKEAALQHLREALTLAVELDPERAAKIGQQILKLDSSDYEALAAICASLEKAGKYTELARTLEQTVSVEPPPPPEKLIATRVRLLELYDDKVPEIEKAAPHVEEVLAHDKDSAIARKVASRLLQNKAAAARVAGALEKVYEIEGDRSGVAQMLAIQIEHVRGPKRAEAQRRLGLMQLEEGDETNAFANFEAVLTIDPSDDEVRSRYVDLARKLGRAADASKMLSRAAAAVKSPQMRARINLDTARFLAELGDPKRARVILHGVLEMAEDDVALEAARTLRGLSLDAKALAPILEAIVKATPDQVEKLGALRELAHLYESSLDDLALAIQARKRVLELDPTAEPEELERLLEARKDWASLADVLEIRARANPDDPNRRSMLLRAAALRAEEVADYEVARTALLAIRAEYGPARDVHAILLPLLERAEDHDALIEVLASEIDLAEEEERSALITRLAESLLAKHKIEDALDALAEVIAVRSDQPRARERLLQLMRGFTPEGATPDEANERSARLRAAQILAPVYRNEDDAAALVEALEVIADIDTDPHERLEALAEAHARIGAIGKDKVRALFLAGRGLREAVTHDVSQVLEWLERIGQSEAGPSKAAVAETLASALRDRAIDHPNLARLAQRTGEAYATGGDLGRAIDAYRRVLELEPDNEEIIERIDHLLAEKGSPEERIALYKNALARPGSDERKRRLYLAIGGVQIDDLQRVDDAIDTFRSALELLTGDAPLRAALLDALEQAKRYGELYEEILNDRVKERDDVPAAELDLRLADVATRQGELGAALRHYKDALAVDALVVGSETLDTIEEMARSQVDVPLLVAVAERRVTLAEPGVAKIEKLEQLGTLVGDRGGDPARAATCFLEAGEQSITAGDSQRAAANFERVLVYQPETRVALERLLGIFAEAGDKRRLLDATERLMKLIEDRDEALELLEQLASVVLEHEPSSEEMTRLEAIVGTLEEKLGRSTQTMRARAEILVSAGRVVEAADAVAALLTADELREDAAALLAEILEAHRDDDRLHPVRRALLEHHVATAAEEHVRARRLELLAFERDVTGDTVRAAKVLDALLEADPQDEDALVARQRIALDSGDFETAARCLEQRLEAAVDEDARVARAGELARLKLGTMKDVGGALDAIEPLVETRPNDPIVREVGLAALGEPNHAGRASALLERVAEGIESPVERAALFAALFERAGQAEDPRSVIRNPGALYRAWLESLEGQPQTALDVAARAAVHTPEDEEFWERAEELARSLHTPEKVANAYREVLASASRLSEETTLRVGERGVAFHEEWFDEAEVVTGMLRQIVEAAPSAAWAFERLKLVYNAAERWQELFDLYDRVILAQPDADSRRMILEDAVEVARDLAADQERAIVYLEQLFALRPKDTKIEAQLERLYERQNKSRSMIQLLTGRLGRLEAAEARATRFRISSLWETAENDLANALGAIAPLVETNDEEAAGLIEGWLTTTSPTFDARAGSFRRLSRAVTTAPFRSNAAKIMEPYYTARSEAEKAANMIEVLLESEADRSERLTLIRSLSDRKSRLGDTLGALEAALAEIAVVSDASAEEEKAAIDAVVLGAARDKELLGRAVDAILEIGEEATDKARSLRLLRRASSIAREELADESRSITLDLAILARSDEDPAGARAAARKLDGDLKAAGRESDRCAVLERLALLEETPEERREALLEAARIAEHAIGDRPRAVDNLQKWLSEAPADVEALSRLIDNLRAIGDSAALVAALEARSNATKSEEEAESDRIEVARLYARVIEDAPKAVAAYRLAIVKHGSTSELVDELADALTSDGRDVELAELLRAEAAKKQPKDRKSALFARLGEVERHRGQLQDSLDAFASALQLVASSAEAQRGLETLIGALSPDEPDQYETFSAAVKTLGESFESAEQMDRWLALVPAMLRASKTDGEKCELLLRAARLEEEVAGNDARALERTVQAFSLRPQLPGVAQALLDRGRKTGRWDLVSPALLPALSSRDDIPALVARDLLVEAAAFDAVRGATDEVLAERAEALLSAAHARVPADQDVLERLIALRGAAAGRPLVDALLSLSRLREGDITLLRDALTTVLRDLDDKEAAVSIAEQIVSRATARLSGNDMGADAEAEDALAWAVDVLEPLWTESNRTEQLRDLYVASANLAIAVDRSRSYLVLAAKLSSPAEAVPLYERLYAADPYDLLVADALAALYAQLGMNVELARLYGRMAESAALPEERARLRLLQSELLVGLGSTDQAISVLRQSIGETGAHEASVALLASLLEEKRAYADLCVLFESQADIAKRSDPERAARFYRRASELADVQLKDVPRAARSFRRVAELDASRESLDQLASLLERARQYEEEAQVLERLMETHGRDDELSLRLAAAYGHAGKVERAREELERAIATGGASPKVREVLASIYRAAGAWASLAELFESEAEEAADEAIKVARLREAAQVYVVELDNPGEAVRLLERAAALRPDDLDAALVLSAAFRAAGRIDDARAQLGKLLEEFGTRKPKERALVHFELAKVALAEKDRGLAITELDNATKIDPANAGVLQLLGEIALEEGQFLRAQRTYRGLLLVLRSQREGRGAPAEGFFAPPVVYKSQVFVELALIAERQKDPERKAEFVESAFEAARESTKEADALIGALERRGYFDLVARALAARLEVTDLAPEQRTAIELRLAEIDGKKLGRTDEAAERAIGTFTRLLDSEGHVPRETEERIAGLLKELGRIGLMYDALRARAAVVVSDERSRLLARAATIAEVHLQDDARAAESLEGMLEAWLDAGAATPEERASALRRLDTMVGRLVASGAAPAERHAKVLDQIVELVAAEGGSFEMFSDAFYRLLEIEVASSHVDAAYSMLERAVREDADGDRVEARLRDAMARCEADNRVVRLLEDFGRERGRGRAVVDALETLADRATDASGHLREAYEASIELEDNALTERLLRRLVPSDATSDTADSVWALTDLADRRFAASDAREAADLWERAARVSDPDDERSLLLRVADLANRVLGDTERAVAIYERLRQHEPADREIWSPLADIHSRRGDTEALAQLMDETIPLVDDLKERAKLRLSLATLLEVTDPDRAADVLTEAMDEDPTNRDTAVLLERLYEATGRDDSLAILLERQLDMAKDEEDKSRVVTLYLRIGMLRERLKDFDAALDAYHGALDWDADNLSALRAAVRLHTEREDSLVMGDLLDRLLEIESGDEAAAIALKVADVKLASGDTVGAERALVVGFKAHPRSSELKQRLVALYTERNDAVGLARISAAEARLLPDTASRRVAILEAAETIKNEGDAREASDLYAEALDIDPADRDTLFYFMETCASSGQQQRAIGAVDRVLALEPNDPWLYFSRAVLREAIGESDSALDDLEAAFEKSGGQYANELRAHLEAALVRIQRDPSASRRPEASIRLRLAEVAAYGGDIDAARVVVEELLQLDPHNAAALAALGKIEELSGRVDAAVLTYSRAVALATGSDLVSIALRLFESSRRIGRIALCRSGLEKAVRANPDDESLRSALRIVYEETGALLELSDLVVEEAQSASSPELRYDKLLEAARLLLYGSGEVSTGPAMAERALAVLEEAKLIKPGDQDALQLTSEALAALGRGEEARAALGSLISSHRGKRSRELGQAFYSLYRVESKSGNLSDALEALARAHDNQPQNGAVALELGQLAVDLDEQDIAQRAFRSVTLLKTDSAAGVTPQERALAYYHLGNIAFRQGDVRRAKLMLEKSLAEDPSTHGARELLLQLG
ncbi:MAG: tetratricopeptide repeat protein [Polyangiaceae bacterium]|nr:tetratricopeptide repeat protein [Polyangiaceae bacterium]